MSSVHAELHRAHQARRAIWKARAVPDDGIDMTRRSPAVYRIMPWAPDHIVTQFAPPPPPPSPIKLAANIALPIVPKPINGIRLYGAGRIDWIVCFVGKRHGLTREALISPVRTARFVLPRHIAAYLARYITGQSFPEIARRMGGRDHTTILSGIRKMRRRTAADFKFGSELAVLECVVRKHLQSRP